MSNITETEVNRNPRHFESPYPSFWDKAKALAYSTLAIGPTTVPVVDLHPAYQPVVDFPRLKADGIEAVVVKLTEATWTVDGAVDYCLRAQDADLGVMVYHWFRSNVNGTSQAEYHLAQLAPVNDRLGYKAPTWADVESSDGVTQAVRRAELFEYLHVTNTYRRRSGYYSSPYLWQQLIGNVEWASDYDGWVAHWTSAATPTLPIGWTNEMVRMWQRGISGKHSWIPDVPAVQGSVDYNLFYGTVEELRAYIGIGVVEPPPDDECKCQEEIAALDERITNAEINIATLTQQLAETNQTLEVFSIKLTELEDRVTALEEGDTDPPPPPIGYTQAIVTDDKTLAKYQKGTNNNGYPIIEGNIYEDDDGKRIRWNNGDKLLVYPAKIRADGGTYWHRLETGVNGKNIVPGEPVLYVKAGDIALQ
jgi:GH25 family lysozyme M1 (1,4-beta-N-acetylmuramidase)/uncharacterized coiled-coil protein SlyX